MKAANRGRGSAAASVVALLLLSIAAGCGMGATVGGNGGAPVVVGSKNFTEQVILGELYAGSLEAGGFEVEKRLNLGNEQIADGALQSGQVDLYPEYTGTALTAILEDAGEHPESPEETYEAAKRLYAEREPAAVMLRPARYESNYGIVVRREVAEERGLATLSDLAEASPELTFVSFSEFLDRQDGYPNMRRHYPALDFGEIVVVGDIGLRYERLMSGDADVGIGFTTDGQLASEELVVLRDEKKIWPFYHPAPVVRAETLEENPEIEDILDRVSATLDVEAMREMTGAVDLEGERPEAVARRHLQGEGLLEGQ
jgi:osmoprotectant transport system substrate-binding protein